MVTATGINSNRLVTENSFRAVRFMPCFILPAMLDCRPPRLLTDRNPPASPLAGLCLTAALFLVSPRDAQAESAATYKFQEYREANGRIAVQSQSALIEQTLGTDTRLKITGVIDAISGATPTGQPATTPGGEVPVAEISDRRKAVSAELSRQFSPVNVALGYANSRENDYISNGWSLNTLTDFNEKNTTLLAGIAGTDDDVKVQYQPKWAKKRTNDLVVGVTQLIDPRTTVSFDVTWGRATGYLSDPYKIVQKRTEVNPGDFLNLQFLENRPNERNKWTAVALLNRAYPDWHGAVEASYRFYHDTFGTDASTLEISWFQRIGKNFILKPELRFHDQSSANFYYYQIDQTSIVPLSGPPTARAPFYSSDYRLSALRTFTYGLKAVWTISDHAQMDVAYEQYDMRGRDGVTAASAYPRASIVTLGLKISW